MTFLLIFLALFLVMQIYFRVALRFNIIDKPNERSSHTLPTIRGGGIIFVIGLLIHFFLSGFMYPYATAGVVLVAAISFMDDISEQPATLRLAIHLLGFLLMGWELSLLSTIPWFISLVVFVIAIAALNTFNFMDGINGITGIYALVCFATLGAIDRWITDFTSENLIISLLLSVVVFLVYNFRKKARCFAGDVGSITLAFLLIFLLLQLMLATGNYGWIVLFTVYGVDSGITILYRLAKKENIFKAHRTHLYQYLANELKYPHLVVSGLYGLIQLVINLVIIVYFPEPELLEVVAIIAGISLLYVLCRERVMAVLGKKGLWSYLSNTN